MRNANASSATSRDALRWPSSPGISISWLIGSSVVLSGVFKGSGLVPVANLLRGRIFELGARFIGSLDDDGQLFHLFISMSLAIDLEHHVSRYKINARK